MRIVGVRFRPAGKIYYFEAKRFEDLEVGEYVVVETAKDRDLGKVVVAPHEAKEAPEGIRAVERRATSLDLASRERNRWKEPEALRLCREKVVEHQLPMKVTKGEYNFDGSKLTIYFTAEKRVDFRDLVRDLAKTLKTRVELRQVGVRDEVKLMGGLGRCGRTLCCVSHLCEFSPVSIKMAKQQDISLNPSEISGLCGRLLCCLAYENETYREAKENLPKVGSTVETSYGSGKVTGINVVKETVSVELKNEVKVEIPADELKGKSKGL
jgi:cell fate regulator YaaT (PSP1 superfamily)